MIGIFPDENITVIIWNAASCAGPSKKLEFFPLSESGIGDNILVYPRINLL